MTPACASFVSNTRIASLDDTYSMAEMRGERAPVVLLVGDHPWYNRALQNTLTTAGFVVASGSSVAEAVLVLRDSPADAIVIDADLLAKTPDFFLTLIRLRLVDEATPLLVMTTEPAVRERRLAALRSGAWHFFGFPLDAEELALRLATLVGAKQSVERAREMTLVDEATGFYNSKGLLRRAQEMVNQAHRHGRPLACVVLAVDPEDADEEPMGTDPGVEIDPGLSRFASLLRRCLRVSDAVGRQGREFIIVAPDTGQAGADGLVRRLTEATATAGDANLHLVTGSYVMDREGAESIEPQEIVLRASLGLRRQGQAQTREV